MKKKSKKKNLLKVKKSKKNLPASKTNKAKLKIKKTKLPVKATTKKAKNVIKRGKTALIKKSKPASKVKKTFKVKSVSSKLKVKKSKIVKKIKPKMKTMLKVKNKKTIATLKAKKTIKPVLRKKVPSKTKPKLLKTPQIKPSSKKVQPIKPITSKLTPVKKTKKGLSQALDEQNLQYIRNLLLKRKTDLESRLTKLEEKFRHTQQEDSGDASSHPLHIGDIASDTETKEQNSYMISSIVKELRKIHGALDRLASGNYGICESCGEQIDINRLKAVPHAEFCIKCGEKSQLF
ncbi:MAG: TraR/DksA C4-type zinc finger protein [bacterium]|nr:TraR/DksA C4-type zinc finger protein [bacterium]